MLRSVQADGLEVSLLFATETLALAYLEGTEDDSIKLMSDRDPLAEHAVPRSVTREDFAPNDLFLDARFNWLDNVSSILSDGARSSFAPALESYVGYGNRDDRLDFYRHADASMHELLGNQRYRALTLMLKSTGEQIKALTKSGNASSQRKEVSTVLEPEPRVVDTSSRLGVIATLHLLRRAVRGDRQGLSEILDNFLLIMKESRSFSLFGESKAMIAELVGFVEDALSEAVAAARGVYAATMTGTAPTDATPRPVNVSSTLEQVLTVLYAVALHSGRERVILQTAMHLLRSPVALPAPDIRRLLFQAGNDGDHFPVLVCSV